MNELFKTVLTLSLFGFLITLVLLCLKPVALKRFPAKWQYYVWVIVLLSMIIPVYKFIPQKEIRKIQSVIRIEEAFLNADYTEPNTPINNLYVPPALENESKVTHTKLKLFDLFSYIWLAGVFVFVITVSSSYIVYIYKRKKTAVIIENNLVLNKVKSKLNIKRNIRVRMSPDISSPMLVGVLFPVVYIPSKEILSDMMCMVFLHELTHYKRKDLIIKWFALFVNAIHWFNPISYIICANLSEACEISCDMEVTKNMNDEEQKLYMKTILELVE